jgi:hypothetical protein
MALLNVSFDAVSEAHLHDLVSTGVPEGVLIEYKSTTCGGGDAEVKEYLKDLSSFANTHGGVWLLESRRRKGTLRKWLGSSEWTPTKSDRGLKTLREMESSLASSGFV